MSREVIQLPLNGQAISNSPAQYVGGKEFHGAWGPPNTYNGRCLTFIDSPGAIVVDDSFVHGDDDSLGFVGNCRGSVVARCEFPISTWKPGVAHALIGYTTPVDQASTGKGPIYRTAQGGAATFYQTRFDGGAIRLNDGVWTFVDCQIVINQLYGIDLGGLVNLIRPRFIAYPTMPVDAGYWYQRKPRKPDGSLGEYDPCGIRVRNMNSTDPSSRLNVKARIFLSEPTLNGVSISADQLCRMYPSNASAKLGQPAYQGPGSVPSEVFVKEPM